MRSGGGSCTDPPFVSPGTPLLHWQQHSDPNQIWQIRRENCGADRSSHRTAWSVDRGRPLKKKRYDDDQSDCIGDGELSSSESVGSRDCDCCSGSSLVLLSSRQDKMSSSSSEAFNATGFTGSGDKPMSCDAIPSVLYLVWAGTSSLSKMVPFREPPPHTTPHPL